MTEHFETESTDRAASDYFIFAVGFGGFMIGVGGVVLSSLGLAVLGALILILSVYYFAASGPDK